MVDGICKKKDGVQGLSELWERPMDPLATLFYGSCSGRLGSYLEPWDLILEGQVRLETILGTE